MPLTRARVLTFLTEVVIALVIGVAVVAAIILYAKVGPFPWMPSVRWWGLAGITGLLLWGAVKQYRRYWPRLSFWLTLGGLFAVHLCGWTIVLLRVSEWGLLWFVPPLAIEAGFLVLALDKLGFHVLGEGESGVS